MVEAPDNQALPKAEESRKIPEVLPILPVIDLTLFPRMVLPLVVHGEESQKLVDEAMAKDRLIGILVSKRNDLQPAEKPEELYEVGTAAQF